MAVGSAFPEVFFKGEEISASLWREYVHPLNQLVFFVGGIVVGAALGLQPSADAGRLSIERQKRWAKWVGLMSLTIFFVISLNLTQVESAKGGWKIILTMLCMGWCYSAGIVGKNSGRIGVLLGWLGAISYSLYLLHPIAYYVVSRGVVYILSKHPSISADALEIKLTVCLVTLGGALVAATISYRFLEVPAVKLGKKFANLGVEKKLEQ